MKPVGGRQISYLLGNGHILTHTFTLHPLVLGGHPEQGVDWGGGHAIWLQTDAHTCVINIQSPRARRPGTVSSSETFKHIRAPTHSHTDCFQMLV